METKVLIRIIVQLSHAETIRKGVVSIADAFAFNLTLTLSLSFSVRKNDLICLSLMSGINSHL